MRIYDCDAVVYRDEYYCVDCANGTWGTRFDRLQLSEQERNDSQHYPQPVTMGESDYPMHCAHCCAWMEHSLTDIGIRYVCELVETYIRHQGSKIDPKHLKAYCDSAHIYTRDVLDYIASKRSVIR